MIDFSIPAHALTSAGVCADRAAAAAGQGGLMSLYDSLFNMMDMQAAQVLVTSQDFSDADFRKNLSITVEDLLAANVVPVFNENDAISSRPQSVSSVPGLAPHYAYPGGLQHSDNAMVHVQLHLLILRIQAAER